MNKILGYYENDLKEPIAYMNDTGVIIFSNNIELKKQNKLGGIIDLHSILSNLEYYNLFTYNKNKLVGGGGFFGESSGKCGWGDSPSCCFFGCEPLWKTNVWPFDITM